MSKTDGKKPAGQAPRRATGRGKVETAPIDRLPGAEEATPSPAPARARRRAANPEPDLPMFVAGLLRGEWIDPHAVLGRHPADGGAVVRAWHPRAVAAEVVLPDGAAVALQSVDERGLFAATLPGLAVDAAYHLRMRDAEGHSWEMEDPYRFLPTLGELDLHLIGQGLHHRLWERLGARVIEYGGVRGTAFSVWAPNARGIALVGDMTGWDDRMYPMRRLGGSGVWELFVPGVGHGAHYKFAVTRIDGTQVYKTDPLARATESPPANACIVVESTHAWGDGDWMQRRQGTDWTARPMSVYEVHLGSWRRTEDNRVLTYRQAARELGGYCRDMGFTHVELMPISEHPLTLSWGYQQTGYYAPTARYGAPDELRAFIDTLHNEGVGVLLDWVPAHFPKDEWGLARFDGTALYEHADPRRGEQPDWGTYLFNLGRNEVRNFLTANARYWCEEFHVDGLRIDAVAAMLYLDYSRKDGEWLPNVHGGRENLESVDFLREVTESLRQDHRGTMTVAEESTSWPGVTQSAGAGGLGFSMKWNMGWMHDTLSYFSKDSVFRRYHHHQLTFGLWYAWSEHYVLPLSHDEVVHGKGSLYGKMPGDRWQRLANLRALYGWMWAHPGKQLLFMGQEFAQEREWSEERGLDWHLLADPGNAGVQRLVRDLNTRYRAEPALWERDTSASGFEWIDAGNSDQNVLSFFRRDASGRPGLACVANLSPAVHHGFRVGLPGAGTWREVVNTDATEYGGSGVGNGGTVMATEVTWNGQPCSTEMTLPPLAVVWLSPPD